MRVKAQEFVHDHVIDEFDHTAITSGKLYVVVGLDNDYFRIIDNNDEPLLYPKGLFTIVDDTIPEDWVREDYPDGEYYIDPPEFSKPGFYEDYFDGVPSALSAFKKYVKSLASRAT